MSKRFTDTAKWDKAWYRSLGPNGRDLWNYLCDKCDHAGVWEIDLEAMSFYHGSAVDLARLEQLFGERIKLLKDNKILLVGFISFQYGNLSDACKPHQRVIQRLKDLSLWVPYTKGFQTLEEEEEDKDKEEDKEGGVGGTAQERHAKTIQSILGLPPEKSPLSDNLSCVTKTWFDVLKHHGAPRSNLIPGEDLQLANALQRYGRETVELVLLGARYEPASDDFKPSRHLNLRRYFDAEKIQRFLNLGAQAKEKLAIRERNEVNFKQTQTAIENQESQNERT